MMQACVLALVLLLASSDALAQQAQTPVFRGGVEVIEVDVSVVNGDGQPIADMLGPEFSVAVDGKPRKVITSQFISTRPPETGTRAGAAEKPDLPSSSNTTAGRGRLIVIAVDRESITFGEGRHVLRAAGKFLDTLGPDDKVAFVTVPSPGPIVGFTSNHELVRRELDRAAGVAHRPRRELNIGVYEAFALHTGGSQIVESQALLRLCGRFRPGSEAWERCELEVRSQAEAIVSDVQHQVDNSRRAIESILESLREIEGPKSLVWISEGLPIEGPGGELAGVGRLAAAARVTVNVLMLDAPLTDISEAEQSPTSREDRELNTRGLEMMAAITRGVLYHVVTNVDAVFRRMEGELSGYYLLAVETAPTDRDGKRHPIKVSVRRRGANVRARRAFQFTPEAAAKNETIEERLQRTLRSPFAVTELPLRLATYAYQDPTSAKVRVLVATEIEPGTNVPADVTIGFALIDADGKVAASGRQRAMLTPSDGLRGPVLEQTGSLTVDPGSYTLKLAAITADGRRGSIEHPVLAWQMSGVPFAVGDLLLADTPTTPGDPIRPPVEARLASGRLAAYTELYAEQPSSFNTTQVRVEVAATESGPALTSGEGVPTMLDNPKSRIISTIIPVDTLPPGDYIARAIVTRGDQKVGQLSRPFRITAASAAARLSAPEAAAASSAGAIVRAVDLTSMLTPPPAFQQADLLKADVVGFFMDVLDKGRPALKRTTALVRTGKIEGAGLLALDTGDQLAAAFLRGLERFAKGDLDQAAAQFVAALRVSPDFAPASFYLGACYAAFGRDSEAATAWRRALLAADKTPVEYGALGDALFRMGDVEQAISRLREALTTWPDDDPLRRRLALAYAVTLQHKDALAAVEPYLTRHPSDHEALLIATHAIYASAVRGQPIFGVDEDRARMTTYVRAYAAAKGPHEALVATWAEFVAKQSAGGRPR